MKADIVGGIEKYYDIYSRESFYNNVRLYIIIFTPKDYAQLVELMNLL